MVATHCLFELAFSAPPPLCKTIEMVDVSGRFKYRTGVTLLAAIIGIINATSFLAFSGVLPALMTGNLLLVAMIFGAGLLSWELLVGYLGAIIPFCIGAFAAGLVINRGGVQRGRFMGYPLEFALVLAATLVALKFTWGLQGEEVEGFVLAGDDMDEYGVPFNISLVIVGLLSFAMGVHNAMMRKHGVANVATNLMTLGLAALFSESKLAGGSAKNQGVRATSILLFVAGAAVSAFLLNWQIAAPLVLASVVFAIALPALMSGQDVN